MELDSATRIIIGIIVISIILFIVLREFFLWYWRINKRVENQEKQIKLLEEIKSLLGQQKGE